MYNPLDPSEGVTPLGKRGSGAYLSPRQFISMRRLMDVNALDQGAGGPVRDLIPYKRNEVAQGIGDTADYDLLSDTMRSQGPKGTDVPPVWLTTNHWTGAPAKANPSEDPRAHYLGNGGHRTAIAHDLGWKAIRWTGHAGASGYDDDEYQKGDDDDYYDGEPNSYAHTSWQHSSSGSSRQASMSYANPSAHNPRSHIPGHTGGSAGWKGMRWHKDSSPGLYTELHGKPPSNLNSQQFGDVKALFGGAQQPPLPGMEI